MRSIGFEPITAEPNIFIDQRGVIAALYVDNLLILAKTESDIERVKNKVKNVHIMKDMGEVSKILGIHVTRPNGFVWIDQNHYIQQILMEFNMENANQLLPPWAPAWSLMTRPARSLARRIMSYMEES